MWEWLRIRFELARETSGVNMRVMEGMRGFAVVLVFFTHFCTLAAPWLAGAPALAALARGVHAIGNAGVDLFFVLSGYLIYRTLMARDQPFGRFMGRRIRRIYPAFLVVFALYCMLSFAFPAESKIPRQAPLPYLVANLLLLPGMFPIEPLITVAWSLSYEMFFYLCLPLVVGGLGLRRWADMARIVLIACAASALAGWSAATDGAHARMIMFMAGMLVHEMRQRGQGGGVAGWGAVALLAAGLLGSVLPVSGYFKALILFASFSMICMHCFLRPGDVLGLAFSWTPLRWLGNMSYSYYLLHSLTLKALFMLLPQAGTAMHGAALLVVLPVFFVLTLVAAAGLYLLVERPLSLQARSSGACAVTHGSAIP